METRKFIAREKMLCPKYNCAQAIICTYCDKVKLDQEEALNIGNAFSTGMGNTEGTCGAIVGAGVILGLYHKDRAKSTQDMKQIMTKFQNRNNATQCKQLKGIETKKVLRECPDCVADAAEFLEEVIA